MKKLRLAYFGTPTFAATLLEKLLTETDIPVSVDLVVTQPDKPVGRQLTITPSLVKEMAKKYRIPVWDKPICAEDSVFFAIRGEGVPLGAKKNSVEAELESIIKQVDLAVVFAYGFKELIPLDLLMAPKMQFDIGEKKTSGFINIHPSLLPKFRGSSPIAYPILLGENKTGVTLFVMDEKMDHGPIVAQEEMELGLNDVRADMETKLTDLGYEMIKKLLIRLATGDWRLAISNQNHALMTRAPFMKREDGFIPFETLQKALKNEPFTLQELPQMVQKYLNKYESCDDSVFFAIRGEGVPLGAKKNNVVAKYTNSARIMYDFWRGMHPWPGVWTFLPLPAQPTRLELARQKRLKITELKMDKNGLIISRVQLEGKKEVDFATFNKAYSLFL